MRLTGAARLMTAPAAGLALVLPGGSRREEQSGEYVRQIWRPRRAAARRADLIAALAAGLALALLGGLLATAPALAAGPGRSGLGRTSPTRTLAPAADPASLAMSATVSPSSLVIGETAVYTVTVQNTGPAAAANVVATLPFAPAGAVSVDSSALPSGCTSAGQTVTCTAATVPAGGSVTYTIPVTVLPSVHDGTNIELRGSATATGGVSASTVLITQAFTKVDVAITKSGPATASPGGTITYTITVKSNGPSDAATVNFTDPTNGNLTTITSYPCGNTGLTVTCQIGTMTPGETHVYKLTVKVNDDVPAGTVITNCATVDTGTRPETNPDNNSSCTDTYVDPVTPVADVEVTKTGPATADPGGTITYTLSVTNHGPDAATNVIVADPVAEPLVTVESLPAGCTEVAGTVLCNAGTLAVNETKTFTFTVKLAGGLAAGTQITDCAQVKSTRTLLRSVKGEPSCVQTVIEAPATADISMAKTGPATVAPGDTYSYTLTATNNGPDAAENVVVTEPTDPSLVTVISVPAGCTAAGGMVTCDAGTLAVGDSRAYAVTVQVNPGVTGVVIPDCAQDYTSTQDPVLTNNQACVNTLVNFVNPARSVIRVTKHGPAVVHPGETMTYSVDVLNRGPDAATDVVVNDPVDTSVLTVTSLPAGCALQGSTVACSIGDLAVGETKTLTFTVLVAEDAAPDSQITNCAAAVSNRSLLTREVDPDCTQTLVLPDRQALLTIEKLAPAEALPGGMIRYAVAVTNHGPDAATDVVIKDPINNPDLVEITSLPAGCALAGGTITCDLGRLAPGETRVLTGEGRVFANLPDGRVIRNCAAVYTTTSDQDLAASQSCVNTVVHRPAQQKFVPVTG